MELSEREKKKLYEAAKAEMIKQAHGISIADKMIKISGERIKLELDDRILDAVYYPAIWAQAQLCQTSDRDKPIRWGCHLLHGHRQHEKMGKARILWSEILRKHCAGNQPGHSLLRHADASYQPDRGSCAR